MAYSVNGVCTRDHPVAPPTLVLVYRYPVKASGDRRSPHRAASTRGHADFINAWDQQAPAKLVASS